MGPKSIMTSTYCTSGVLKEFVNVVLITSTETIGLFRDGGQWGKGVRRWGKREFIIYIYLSLHCHHQNDSCIKTGSEPFLM